MGDTPINKIGTPQLNAFRTYCRAEGLSPDSIENGVRIVLQILRLCCKFHLLTRLPDAGAALKKFNGVKYTPPLEDLSLMYDAADCTEWPAGDSATFWRCLFATAFWTGLRKGDLFYTLSWEHLQGDQIAVTARKTGKPHVFPGILSSIGIWR